MNVLVTGGAGFIGSYVVKALADEGHCVTALDRNPDRAPGLRRLRGVEIVGCDLADFGLVERHLASKEACIHLALGCWGVGAYEFLMRDTRLSVWLFEKAAEAGVEHFVYTSTGEVFGTWEARMTEQKRPDPVHSYGASKAAGEHFLMAVSHSHRMRCNIVRPNFTFGNPVVEGGPIEADRRLRDICARARRGEEIVLKRGDGTQAIWAGDLARVYLALLGSNVNRQVYHGMGVSFVSSAQIAEEAARQARSGSRITLTGEAGQPCVFDMAKLKEHFGLEFDSWPRIVEHVTYLLEHKVE
jgi:UDP-glucose 4-epimerase